ncbi:MAG: cupin domain-containing protein [Alphaproteobacteria bacterium]|jgi:uncharacterized protein|nr:cupin domain-containing protein [Alphaproteobacteria bacterium]
MIDLKAFGDLLAYPKGNFAPKPTTLTPGQEEALQPLWESIDGLTKVGIWDCTPGRFTADRTGSAEICHILSGRASVINKDGNGEVHLKAGDLLILPIGWCGEWVIHEDVRKTYALLSPR